MKQQQEQVLEPEIHQFAYIPHAVTKVKVRKTENDIQNTAELQVFLGKHHYHWLPGSRPGIDVYESSEAASRFLVKLDLSPRFTFIISNFDSLDSCAAFLDLHSNKVPLLPVIWMPEAQPAPNNYVTAPALTSARRF